MTNFKRQQAIAAKKAYCALMTYYPLTLENLPGEKWLPLSKNYQLSNFGRLKGFYHKQPQIIKPQLIGLYLGFDLSINGKRHRCLVHRLVAKLFITNINNKPQVNHRDGNKFNNHTSNLEWVTATENIHHALVFRLKKSGENNYRASLTNEQVKWLRLVYKPRDKEFGATALAHKLGVNEQVIRLAIRGKHYKFI